MTSGPDSLLIVGVGAATGAALCHEFAADHDIALVARSDGTIKSLAAQYSSCHAYQCDVSHKTNWSDTLDAVEQKIGIPQKIIFNTEGGGIGPFDTIDIDAFDKSFSVMVTSLLQMAQKWFPRTMELRQNIKMLINASPAAFEPDRNFTGLGSGRAAQRFLADNLRQSTKDHGIKIGILSIDGPIDEPKMRQWLADQPDSAFIKPAAIAARTREIFAQDQIAFRNDIRPDG